jgi:bifunctional DNA-binding transcriptional regulator/antitoxin component of YhaV-PrlF toxin-antitoxin module
VEVEMLVKRTSKNQITLPKKIADQFPGVGYFQVTQRGTSIILEPLEPSRAYEVREKLARLGIDEDDVARAVAWARERES